jgi:hypothetical protein
MADNVIKVSVTSTKSQRVSVSSSQQATNITASPDTGRFWSQTSKNWAVSGNIVDGEDYSSKYYANKSKENANTAKSYLDSTQETYNSFVTDSNNYISDLIEIKEAGKEEINSAKTTIINDIEFVADGEKKEIEALVDNGKDELRASIGNVKILATLEIGDIGIAPLGIDETQGKRRYLNGQLIIQDQYVEFTKKVKSAVALYPSLACTESEWQTTATMTVGGQVGKFVVDDEAGTIRLPKIIMPIQGLTDLSKLGEIVEAGLPNIEGSFGYVQNVASNYFANGAFELGTRISINDANNGTTSGQPFEFDASLSNPIYGNSATVQQEAIQYPYFIQVATGAEVEDNIINEIELNNPFSLLDYKYSEYELNNASWLRSNGQYNSKAIYPAVYDLLLKIYNGVETKAGVSVKLWTDESATDYDFRINTAEETFVLPTKVKANYFESIAPVVGNGMVLGLTNGTTNAGLCAGMGGNAANNTMALSTVINQYGLSVGRDANGGGSNSLDTETIGVTTDPTKSGIEAHLTENTDLYLYFYVGETVQNANLINAGRVMEEAVLRSSLVEAQVVVETYKNGTSWYRVWSDGWCEQGGVLTIANGTKIYFLQEFKDKNYEGHITERYATAHGSGQQNCRFYPTATDYATCCSGVTAGVLCQWIACGYIW